MSKNAALKVLNPILVVLVVSQALSAIFADDLSFQTFQWLHKGGGALLLIGIGLHIVLNWPWFRANLLPRKRKFKH